MGKRNRADGGWKVDKQIPIALIVMTFIQVIGFAVWITKVGIQSDNTALQVNQILVWRDSQSTIQGRTEGRLAVIEERSKEQSETLHRIDDRLEKTMIYKVK